MIESEGPASPENDTAAGGSYDFDRGADQDSPGFFGEFYQFLRDNKLWWMTPIILAILLLGLLVIAGGSGAAPFIYTLF